MHVSNLDLKELQYRMQQEDEEGYEERHVHPQDEESHWTPPAEGDDNFKVPEVWHAAAAQSAVLAHKQRQPLDIMTYAQAKQQQQQTAWTYMLKLSRPLEPQQHQQQRRMLQPMQSIPCKRHAASCESQWQGQAQQDSGLSSICQEIAAK
jgi:hypothetical protein